MEQNHVSGGANVLCWLATTVAMFYGNLPKISHKVQYHRVQRLVLSKGAKRDDITEIVM